MNGDSVLSLIDEIYGAAVDPTQWPRVLTAFAAIFSSDVGVLFHQGVSPATVHFALQTGISEDYYSGYLSHYQAVNVWQPHMARLKTGGISDDLAVMPVRELKRTEFYNDWLRPQGLVHALGGNILNDTRGAMQASVLRSSRRGPFSHEEMRLLKQLVPHFQRAVQIQRELFLKELHTQSALQGLDRLMVGMILVSDDARPLFCNSMAERILNEGEGLGVQQGRLRAATPAMTNSLHEAIRNSAATGVGKGSSPGEILPLPSSREKRMCVLVSPIKPENDLFRSRCPVALVFVSDDTRDAKTQAGDLMQAFGLTRAEAGLVRGLLNGLSLVEYADIAKVSVLTVRTQLKEVFAKMEVNTQSGLMRRVLGNPILAIGREK